MTESNQIADAFYLGKHGSRECSNEQNRVTILMSLPSNKRPFLEKFEISDSQMYVKIPYSLILLDQSKL